MKEKLSKVVPTGLKLPKAHANGNGHATPAAPAASGQKTPKTPQDEALAFFSSDVHDGEPVQVWELWLENDGGPADNKSVSGRESSIDIAQHTDNAQYIRLPPPTRPYVLRLSLHPGTPCTQNGKLKSGFPIDGGVFERGSWKERALPSDVSK